MGSSMTAPLDLAWKFPHVSGLRKVWADGILVGLDETRNYGSAKIGLDGKEIWRIRFGNVCRLGDVLLGTMGRAAEDDGKSDDDDGHDDDDDGDDDEDGRILEDLVHVDAATGAILHREASRYSPHYLLPDGKSFLCFDRLQKTDWGGRKITLTRVSLEPGLPVIWEIASCEVQGDPESGERMFGESFTYIDGRIYVPWGGGLLGPSLRLLCFDAEGGSELWSLDAPRPVGLSSNPRLVASGNRLVIEGTEGLWILDTDTLQIIGTVPLGGDYTVEGDILHAMNGKVYRRVDLRTGEQILEYPVEKQLQAVRKNYYCDGVTPPIVTDEYLFFGDSGGHLWAIEKDTGKPVWVHRAPGCTGFHDLPQRHGDSIYIDSTTWDAKKHPATLYCYRPRAGAAAGSPS